MAQIRKVECSNVCKAPVDQMYDILTTKIPLMPTLIPDHIHSVNLVQGRWGEAGCVIICNFNFQGKIASAKEILEVIDKENGRLVFKVIEGGPLEYYKSFKWTFQACRNDNVVKWSMEYEKDNEDVPDPTAYLDLVTSMTKGIDAKLAGQ